MRKTHGGVSFVIDRPKGYTKHWPDKSFTYPCDYGYFPGLKGEDGEGLDAFVGDDTDGHYESFQKLTSDAPPVLDETKFLVGVNTADREKIYALYGNEIHARRIYRGMSELKAALEKFETKKKGRYMKTAEDQEEGERSSALEDHPHWASLLPLGPQWLGYQRGKPHGRKAEGVVRASLGEVAGHVVGAIPGQIAARYPGYVSPDLADSLMSVGARAGGMYGSHYATRGLLDEGKTAAHKTVIARYKLSDLKQADIEKLIRGNIIGLKGGDNQGPAEAANDEDRLMRTFRDADSKASEGTEGGGALPQTGGLTL